MRTRPEHADASLDIHLGNLARICRSRQALMPLKQHGGIHAQLFHPFAPCDGAPDSGEGAVFDDSFVARRAAPPG